VEVTFPEYFLLVEYQLTFGSDDPPSNDKAFKRYTSGVDRALSLFDNSILNDWADIVSFLSRLLKALQTHPPSTKIIPSKAVVAKRLAQCLNPSLPSGVHQKALEVYRFVFSMIGIDALSRDLHLYLPGLSTTLSFASLSVRTPFLELLETHLLNLDSRSLRPALKAIILSLLPGLEEETSEDFERTLKLVDRFKQAARPLNKEDLGHNHSSGDEYFWQCFFLASITSNGRRLGALAYLVRNLPKLGQSHTSDSSPRNGAIKDETDDKYARITEIVTSPEPGLLLRCFTAGLADDQILIQRGFLDLLVTHLPLHAHVLQERVKKEDLELLITAAAGVVGRRDMSLNRRLWTWLLGPEILSNDNDAPESPLDAGGDRVGTLRTRYFEEFGLQPLTKALLRLIGKNAANPVERARPFRICLSLMDRWEIGGLVVPDIFLPVVNSVREYKDKASTKADFSEVLRSASVFFDGVESGLIWGEIIGLVVQAIGVGTLSAAERLDKLYLVNFIIGHFNVREEEMLLIHAPLTVLTILAMLEERPHIQTTENDMSDDISRLALSVAADLIDIIPERAFQTRPPTNQSSTNFEEEILSNAQILQSIRSFYVQDQGNLDAFPPPFTSRDINELLLRELGGLTCQSLCDPVSSADAGVNSRLLVNMLAKVPKAPSLGVDKIMSSMHSILGSPAQLPFLTLTSITSLATAMFSSSYITSLELSSLVDPLVRLAWSYLSASHPKYHVETVRCLWQLQTMLSLSNHEIEASICSLMIEHDLNGTFAIRDADPGRSFSILWTHTLQDNAGHLDRRLSKASSNEVKGPARLSGIGNYEVMLARPLFLLLDALLDDRTQLFMTVRTWLQSLVGIDKCVIELRRDFRSANNP
jgi:hypothetical protein